MGDVVALYESIGIRPALQNARIMRAWRLCADSAPWPWQCCCRFAAVAQALAQSEMLPEADVLKLLRPNSMAAFNAMVQADLLGFCPNPGPISTVRHQEMQRRHNGSGP